MAIDTLNPKQRVIISLLVSKMRERWDALVEPAWEINQKTFGEFRHRFGHQRNVLNCAVPLARAKTLTDFALRTGSPRPSAP
jgi:hypothetical protein